MVDPTTKLFEEQPTPTKLLEEQPTATKLLEEEPIIEIKGDKAVRLLMKCPFKPACKCNLDMVTKWHWSGDQTPVYVTIKGYLMNNEASHKRFILESPFRCPVVRVGEKPNSAGVISSVVQVCALAADTKSLDAEKFAYYKQVASEIMEEFINGKMCEV